MISVMKGTIFWTTRQLQGGLERPFSSKNAGLFSTWCSFRGKKLQLIEVVKGPPPFCWEKMFLFLLNQLFLIKIKGPWQQGGWCAKEVANQLEITGEKKTRQFFNPCCTLRSINFYDRWVLQCWCYTRAKEERERQKQSSLESNCFRH